MLQSMATGSGSSPSTASSYVELAAVLGVTRQSINTWKKRKDSPKPASNGMHDVSEWKEFMRQNELKGGEEKTAVVVVMENRLTSVATRHHVVKGAGKFDTQAPWHAAKIGQR
jgi:hypothetical protein